MYVVRGPVSAGLRTRTPGVGLKRRAVAAVAVARRRIMVLGAARASRYGVLPLRQGPAGWGSARAPPPRFSGGAAGRASSGGFGTRVDPQCGGESASMAAREARICGEHGPLVQTSAQFQRSRRHGGKPSPDASPGICRGCSSERRPDRAASWLCATGADEPAEAMSTTMRGTGSAQVQLIHKAPTPAAAATAPLTRSPPAPAATPRRRCSVETG